MSSDDEDVRSLLRALTPQIKRCKEPLSAVDLDSALYGLRDMSSDDEDVRSLLRALMPQIKRCKEPLSAEGVGTALSGL